MSNDKAIISRRNFLAGAAAVATAGFLEAMPNVPGVIGGVLYPVRGAFAPGVAHAAENGSYYTLKVVGLDQVSFRLVDTATKDEDGEFMPVKNATIIIKTLDGEHTISAVTDEDGDVLIDLGPIALRNEDGSLAGNSYQCEASIEVDTSNSRYKMRRLVVGRVHLEGATGFVLGGHKLEENDDVYLAGVAFDGWDILYIADNTFTRSTENTMVHNLALRINTPKAPKNILIKASFTEVWKDKSGNEQSEKKSFQVTPTKVGWEESSGFYLAEFKEQFLLVGNRLCMNGDKTKLDIQYKVDSKTYHLTTYLCSERAPIEGAQFDSPFVPFLMGDDALGQLSIDFDTPVFDHVDVTYVDFSFPLKLQYTPYCLMLALGKDFSFLNDKNKLVDANEWNDQVGKGNLKKFGESLDKYAKGVKNLGERKPFEDDNGNRSARQFAKKFSIDLLLQAVVGMQFRHETKDGAPQGMDGKFAVGFGLSLKGQFTFRFTIGPVPFFLGIGVGCDIVFALAGIVFQEADPAYPKLLDINNLNWIPNGSLSLNITPAFTLSLGVGIDGVLSLGVSGAFAIPVYMGWFEANKPKGADDTHITLGLTFKAELFAQLMMFRVSARIWSWSKNPALDNWEKYRGMLNDAPQDPWDDPEAKPRYLLTQPDGTKRHSIILQNDNGQMFLDGGQDLFTAAVPVTTEDMGASFEAKATREHKPPTVALGDLPALYRDVMPVAVKLDDGSYTTQFVPCEGVNCFVFDDELPTSAIGLPIDRAEKPALKALDKPQRLAMAPVPSEGLANESEDAIAANGDAGAAQDANAFGDEAFILGDPYLGFAANISPEYEYESVEGKTTGNVCDLGGIRGIAEGDGIRPNVDVVIYDGVFSDPRQRIVSIQGTPYLFRIMTVDYTLGGKPRRRSRLVASKFNTDLKVWEEPRVIEFPTGRNSLKRIDMFDYDFDVIVRSEGSTWTRHADACVVITGGLRPHGDDTHINEVFTTPTVSVVLLGLENGELTPYKCAVQQASDLYDDGRAHMLCMPQICDGLALDSVSGALAFSYLHRSADNASQILSDEESVTVTADVGYFYVRDGVLSVTVNTSGALNLDRSVLGLSMVAGTGKVGSYDAHITLLCPKNPGYQVCSVLIPRNGSFADLQFRHNISSSQDLPQISPWPGHGTFLFTKTRPDDEDPRASDYYLYAASFDPTVEGQPGFEDNPTRVDSNGLRGSSFSVSPTGRYLFYYECFDGSPGDDVNLETGERTPIHKELYRLMASKLIGDKFSEDFPFCEIDSPIDGFEVMNITSDASTFLATEIIDADHSLARLRYIAVPHSKVAEVEGFAPIDDFVCAGQSCNFRVDVRNHGNLIIGGFDVVLCDADAGNWEVGTFNVQTIDPARVVSTPSTRRDWTSALENPEKFTSTYRERVNAAAVEDPDGSLAMASVAALAADAAPVSEILPGELLSYRVEFNIPQDWRTKRRVLVKLQNVWTHGMQGILDGAIETLIHDGLDSELEIHADENTTVLTDPDEWVVEDEERKDDPAPKPDDGTNPKPSGGTTPKGNGGTATKSTGQIAKGSATAKTADLIDPLLPLGVAVGGLGALMSAYTMRRLENEREQAQEGSHGENEERD